ncbi:Cadherin-related family member 3 [Varanus komodoensis]|nr:Cadherin-related family member 3 [Varanus komodoensis]
MKNVVTTGSPMLDYETMPHRFELQILVFDSAGARDLQILTVQVLDFSLTPASVFHISETGTISSEKAFDYEKDPHNYILNVVARDHSGLNTSRTVIVSIINTNDEPPYFTMKENVFKIREESAPGYVVTNLMAMDPDGEDFNNSLRFSISNPAGIPNFAINPVTGAIIVTSRIDRDNGRLREHPNITLEVRVVDSPSGTQSATTEIVITIEDINDNPPECKSYSFSFEFLETMSNGSAFIDLKDFCFDIDAKSPNNLFNFTGLSGVGSNMHLFGHYPAHDDFYLVVCNICNQVVKPQVFQSHCARCVVYFLADFFLSTLERNEGFLAILFQKMSVVNTGKYNMMGKPLPLFSCELLLYLHGLDFSVLNFKSAKRRHGSICKPSPSPASPPCNSRASLIQMKPKSCISGHNPVNNNSKPFKTPKDNLITSTSKQHMVFSSKVSRDKPCTTISRN